MNLRLRVPLLLVALFATAKGSNCPQGKDTLLTYNAGLTPTVPNFESRRDRIPGAVSGASSDADFLCFQELWYEEDVRRVLEAVKDDFPYHYSYLHYGISDLTGPRPRSILNRPSCGARTIYRLLRCLAANCLNAADQQTCMVLQCTSKLFNLSSDCLACVSLSFTDVWEVLRQCVYKWGYNRFNTPGLLVASRRPMTEAEYVSFNPGVKVLLERGYIKARVKNRDPFVCTQLTAIFPFYFEVNLPYNSYEEQQQAEIQELIGQFSGSPHVLLGDLNTGPERSGEGETDINGEAPENYNLLESSGGYDNPYLNEDGQCTYCYTNPLVQAQGYNESMLIDHILLNHLASDSSSVQRILDEPVQLSDHYGMRVDVCRPGP